MSLTETLLALHAFEESVIDRRALAELLDTLDSWRRAGLEGSAATILIERHGVDPARVRGWESRLAGDSHHRLGRYTLIGEIGRGGIGIVFEARHPNLDRPVALKVLAGDRRRDPVRRSRFEDEIHRLGRLNHPNIVHALDAGHEGDLPYLVMEMGEGETLLDRLRRLGPVTPDEAIDWIVQGSHALEAIAEQGWIHGDVKPSNWILAGGGRLVLTDLGMCRPVSSSGREVLPGGTAAYLAPELILGKGGDIRSDIYSLGATFWHLLTGKKPVVERSLDQLRRRLAEGDLPIAGELRELRIDLPEPLAATIEEMLEFDRNRRPKDLPALRSRFDPPSAQVRRTGGKRRRVTGIFLALVIVSLLLLLQEPEENQPEQRLEPAVEETVVATTPLGEEWQRRAALTPRDHRELFAWLLSAALEDPRQGEWLDRALSDLETEAAPAWATIDEEVSGHLAEGELMAARGKAADFPPRLRAGRFHIEHQKLSMEIETALDRRLASSLLEMEAQPETLSRWQLWRELELLDPPDTRNLRARMVVEMGGLPFLTAIEELLTEAMIDRVERPLEVRRSLAQGEIPRPDFRYGDRLPEEVAILFLSENEELLATEGSLEWRLHETNLLADIDLDLWPLLEPLVSSRSEGVNPVDEREAARSLRRGLALAERWNLEGLDEWQGLDDGSRLSRTVAARAVSGLLDRWRHQLRRGAFLRSGVLAAKVEGEWGKGTRFSWSTGESLNREWRWRGRDWRITEGGISPRQETARMECSLPFRLLEEVSVEIGGNLSSPLVFGWGDDSVALESAPGIEVEGGWLFHLKRQGDVWLRGTGDQGQSLRAVDSDEPRWVWIEVGAGTTVRAVSVRGALQGVWSDERQRLTRGREEDRK